MQSIFEKGMQAYEHDSGKVKRIIRNMPQVLLGKKPLQLIWSCMKMFSDKSVMGCEIEYLIALITMCSIKNYKFQCIKT
jgi:hypothetical protein